MQKGTLMSSNTHSSNRKAVRLVSNPRGAVLAGALATLLSAGAALANTEEFRLQGEGTLRWFGLKIYDARLLSAQRMVGEKTLSQPFALELTYARSFSGAKIAETSLDEMRKFTQATPEQLQRWQAAMERLFPSVTAGDRLRGVFAPGQAATFYFNDRPIGSIDDAEFARAFFSIWLDPRTAKPELRRQLLGLAPAQGS